MDDERDPFGPVEMIDRHGAKLLVDWDANGACLSIEGNFSGRERPCAGLPWHCFEPVRQAIAHRVDFVHTDELREVQIDFLPYAGGEANIWVDYDGRADRFFATVHHLRILADALLAAAREHAAETQSEQFITAVAGAIGEDEQ